MKNNHAKQGDFRHAKALGQNFLDDEALLSSIADACCVTSEDTVFEVGAGLGSLSVQLAKRCKQLITAEVDARLFPYLKAAFLPYDNITLLEGNALRLDLSTLLRGREPVQIIANLPYYLTTAFIEQFLNLSFPIKAVNVMVQKEVGEKILSEPGRDGWGPLPIRARVMTEPRLALDIPARCFTPPPKVDSVFLTMPLRLRPLIPPEDQPLFFRTVQAAFSQKRKTLLNNLMPAFGLGRETCLGLIEKAGLPPGIRAEQMSLEAFEQVARAVRDVMQEKKEEA